MATDTLSDVLRTVRLRGAAFYAVRAGADWAVAAPPAVEIAEAVLPGAGHVMAYHVLIDGAAWAGLPGGPLARLAPGDVVLFPQGDAHLLCSAPGVPPLRFSPEWVRATQQLATPFAVAPGVGGAFAWGASARPDEHPPDSTDGGSSVACGFLGCDHGPFNPLLDALPRMLHVPAEGDGAWLRQLMRQAIEASAGAGPGACALAERMGETMFIDTVRRHAARLPDGATGWLAGLRDRQIARALALIHAEPQRPWTVDALARAAALSRSAFCERFARLVGAAPARYLARWRMARAGALLRQSRAPVAAIALAVGYESEAAFTRAFARVAGMPPSRWRGAADVSATAPIR
ncbi:AraC-like DNA-binding protein [Pseudoduganella lurida]|uniref:AraC-like DNA-binding protein n=1 Tax=Pseudoduganella lurida TaxID=1036180 RepID=A0A562REE3_9BURK|nr:AraC family transcriptional regulator [Pseudoduganella lurida]TWI67293.1 AraC-like DNA-binding protein [Pseudoduganella lurida]